MYHSFNWDGFTATDFANYCTEMENEELYAGDHLGCVRIGELYFDLYLSLRDFDSLDPNALVLTFDLYVGGAGGDNPYAYSVIEPDFPYAYAEGLYFEDTCISMTYDDFVAMAEDAFTRYINHSYFTNVYDLPAKAVAPLHIW